MAMKELCVPESALAQSGEDGGAVAPDVGDEVEVSVRGTVTRKEGGNVYFTPATANGEPISDQGGSAEPDEDDAMDREMARYDSSESEGML